MILLAGCTPESSRPNGDEPTFTKEGTLAFIGADGDTLRTIDIEIADTDTERRTGLMRRRSMSYNRGMLFIFESVDKGSMWMKNTPMPLDIVFVSPDSQVINIARRTTPLSTDPIEPEAPRKYVVEVRAGFADRYGLTDDARIRWQRADDSS